MKEIKIGQALSVIVTVLITMVAITVAVVTESVLLVVLTTAATVLYLAVGAPVLYERHFVKADMETLVSPLMHNRIEVVKMSYQLRATSLMISIINAHSKTFDSLVPVTTALQTFNNRVAQASGKDVASYSLAFMFTREDVGNYRAVLRNAMDNIDPSIWQGMLETRLCKDLTLHKSKVVRDFLLIASSTLAFIDELHTQLKMIDSSSVQERKLTSIPKKVVQGMS